jgi:uncharacterized RDD family membrane protein YckC
MARRVGARIVDLVVISWLSLFVLVEVLGRLFGGDPLGRDTAVNRLSDLSSTRTFVGVAVVLVGYEVLPVALRGATLGKAMLGVRVVRLDTWTEPGVLSATIRAAVLYGPLAVPTVGLLLFAVVITPGLVWPTRRGLHDLAAGTAVVGVVPDERGDSHAIEPGPDGGDPHHRP